MMEAPLVVRQEHNGDQRVWKMTMTFGFFSDEASQAAHQWPSKALNTKGFIGDGSGDAGSEVPRRGSHREG